MPKTCPTCTPVKRCPLHAREYVVRTMSGKGWEEIRDENIVTGLAVAGFRLLEWSLGTGQKNYWAPNSTVAIASCRNIVWETRKFLLAYAESHEPGSDEFCEVVTSAHRLGGEKAVEEVLRDWGGRLGLALARAGQVKVPR